MVLNEMFFMFIITNIAEIKMKRIGLFTNGKTMIIINRIRLIIFFNSTIFKLWLPLSKSVQTLL